MSARLRLHAAPATPVLVAAAVVLTAVGLLTLSGAEAADNQPSCGDTITVDTTLESDLVDCPNNGIVIGADDVTLDLNGHTVSGDGEEFKQCGPDEFFCDVGVLNVGNDGFRLEHGAVRDFAVGPLIGDARDNRVVDVSSTRNTVFGFLISESAQILIRDSSGNDNIPPEGDGIGLFASHHVQILDSSFRHNPGPGIHVAGNHNVIEGNRISHNSPGILMGGEDFRADRNRVRRNRFARNRGGIILGPGSRNVIARNHLSRDGSGIGIEKGRRNLVERNVVVDARGRGISLGLDFADGTSIGGRNNVVRGNVVRGSAGDAFLVNKKGSSVLRRNLASGAKGDGFHIESRSTKLTKNRAPLNAAIGIEAVRGVIDGGGNRANGNGGPHQCTHIACN